MLNMIRVGELAPEFSFTSNDGKVVKLSELLVKGPICLVFYPADETPVCTVQLCEIRDNWELLTQKGVQVLGINPSTVARHEKFAEKNSLPFPLVHDEDAKIAKSYGSHILLGLIYRTVYLIDHHGKVLFAQRGKPSVHEILSAVQI